MAASTRWWGSEEPGKSLPLGTRYMPKKLMGKHEAYLACCSWVVVLWLRMLMLQLLLGVVRLLLLLAVVPLVGLGLTSTDSPIVLVLLVPLRDLVCRLGRLEGLSLGVSLLILLHFFS